MNELNFIFVWLAGFLILSNVTDLTVLENVDGKMVRRWRKGAAFLVFLPIFWIACFGTPRGDTWLYISNFKEFPSDWEGLLQRLSGLESGYSFDVFQFVIKKIFGNNINVFRVLIALIHSIPIIAVYRKYSENYLMSMFIFVASAIHVSWMMNGLRQFMAAALIFAATPLLIKKKYFILIAIILFAATIHVSALIMLPVIFIVQGNAWNEKTIAYIVIVLIAMYALDKYTGLANLMLEGTEFQGAVEQWREWGDNGTNPVRVLVNAIPMILALIGKTQVEQENDRTLNIYVNMSVITTGLYLVSMVTSGIMIGRLPIYISLYNLILLPNLIPKVFTKDSIKIVNILMIGSYMAYYFIEMRGY